MCVSHDTHTDLDEALGWCPVLHVAIPVNTLQACSVGNQVLAVVVVVRGAASCVLSFACVCVCAYLDSLSKGSCIFTWLLLLWVQEPHITDHGP